MVMCLKFVKNVIFLSILRMGKHINTLSDVIFEQIRSWERGRIFFIDDFNFPKNQSDVRMTLAKLTSDREIVRLARGVYCYPKTVGEYGIQTVLPSPEMIAEAIARREKVRIIPYGDQASCRLGLSGAVVSDLKYLTDGAPRHIRITGGKTIYFNHTSEVKMFAYRNGLMQSLASAVRFLQADAIDEQRKRIIREHLRSVSQEDFEHDITIPPAWVAKILTDIWNN